MNDMQRAFRCAVAIVAVLVAWGLHPVKAQIAPGVLQSAAQTATVSGTVLRSDGKPVADADVALTGANAHLTARSDTNGTFSFVSVPFGTYRIAAENSQFGNTFRDGIVVRGDIVVTIQYVAEAANLKEIAHVSTQSAGARINVTPASIASVTPSAYAFAGNPTWRALVDDIPGVTVGGALNAGANTNLAIPDSPFQPVILSINGALPYETSTTFDGMPLSNFESGFGPGIGVDLGLLPMPLFDAADVVRGPGANAPSIVDSVGGAFVLHGPGIIEKNSLEISGSNDPFGGYFSNAKATFRFGHLSGAIVYGLNNSPGPIGGAPVTGTVAGVGTINGTKVAAGGSIAFLSNPVYGNCSCVIQTSLLGTASGLQNSLWSEHDGGIGLTYQLGSAATAQVFYAGSSAIGSQAVFKEATVFTPTASYGGPLPPGVYSGIGLNTNRPSMVSQSESLLEQKITVYLGRGVLRLAALQNYSYDAINLLTTTSPVAIQLFGTGTYCANPACTSTTPFVFNGQNASLTFNPSTGITNGSSTNSDLLASYENQLTAKLAVGVSFVRSANSGSTSSFASLLLSGVPFTFFSSKFATQTVQELRLHANAELSEKLALDGSYYIVRGNYHVPDPSNPGRWVDSNFPYSAPRVGVTFRANKDIVLRGAAGGGFALPPLFNLVGVTGLPSCNLIIGYCTISVTNINLQPERSFGFDLGTDIRFRRDTAISFDLYRTDLFGQLFTSAKNIGNDVTTGLPIFAQESLNLAHSRFEGITLEVNHDIPRGTYWNLGLGLTRGYIVSVPPGFYDNAGTTCNFATGVGCQNTYAIPNQNFDGKFQSTVPYANGTLQVGYRWSPRKYVDIQANYQGNNNAYFQPAFVEFDAHGSYPVTKNIALIAIFRNVTGIHDDNYQFLTVNPNLIAPTVAGTEFPLRPIPYGPRTLTVTANIQL